MSAKPVRSPRAASRAAPATGSVMAAIVPSSTCTANSSPDDAPARRDSTTTSFSFSFTGPVQGAYAARFQSALRTGSAPRSRWNSLPSCPAPTSRRPSNRIAGASGRVASNPSDDAVRLGHDATAFATRSCWTMLSSRGPSSSASGAVGGSVRTASRSGPAVGCFSTRPVWRSTTRVSRVSPATSAASLPGSQARRCVAFGVVQSRSPVSTSKNARPEGTSGTAATRPLGESAGRCAGSARPLKVRNTLPLAASTTRYAPAESATTATSARAATVTCRNSAGPSDFTVATIVSGRAARTGASVRIRAIERIRSHIVSSASRRVRQLRSESLAGTSAISTKRPMADRSRQSRTRVSRRSSISVRSASCAPAAPVSAACARLNASDGGKARVAFSSGVIQKAASRPQPASDRALASAAMKCRARRATARDESRGDIGAPPVAGVGPRSRQRAGSRYSWPDRSTRGRERSVRRRILGPVAPRAARCFAAHRDGADRAISDRSGRGGRGCRRASRGRSRASVRRGRRRAARGLPRRRAGHVPSGRARGC